MIVAAVVTSRPRADGLLLGRQQPPVGRLSAVAQLELDPAVEHPVELAEPDWRILAGEHADQLGRLGSVLALRQPVQDRLQRLARIPPGEHLLLDKADRVAALEAPPRIVA